MCVLQSLNKFFGQPDDGLHTGPKHVVVYYTDCNIVVFMTVWTDSILAAFMSPQNSLCASYVYTQGLFNDANSISDDPDSRAV